jgi:hypothetical protein
MIPCGNCEKVYIGQTDRKREIRMKEHQSKIKRMEGDSKLVEHILANNHKFDFSKVETLAWETEWKKRIIKESLLTQEKLGKAINDIDYNLNVFG